MQLNVWRSNSGWAPCRKVQQSWQIQTPVSSANPRPLQPMNMYLRPGRYPPHLQRARGVSVVRVIVSEPGALLADWLTYSEAELSVTKATWWTHCIHSMVFFIKNYIKYNVNTFTWLRMSYRARLCRTTFPDKQVKIYHHKISYAS